MRRYGRFVTPRGKEEPALASDAIPEFGDAEPGAHYILRPGGYAVIFDASGHVAVIATPRGYHLPGGGQNGDEPLSETTVREVREEGGLEVRIVDRIGTADELVYAPREGLHFRKRGNFFLAEVVGYGVGKEPDHRLEWMPAEQAASELVHGSHRWAVAKVRRLAGLD